MFLNLFQKRNGFSTLSHLWEEVCFFIDSTKND